ncbi:MAG: metallopeptidase TldD-related protein [Burkholderiaceae bacterium]|jgi:predicted Zn-dependent protease|nr:metallopeptidase TldD-related protein [Burkholderiaceae bacterium]
MKDLFFALADRAFSALQPNEVALLNFSGEVTDFVRFNHAQVRQPMTVRQARLSMALIEGRRRNQITLALSGTPEQDGPRLDDALLALRAELPTLPEDPYLLYSTAANRSERIDRGALPSALQTTEDIVETARGTDLVGVLGSGPIMRGFASSLGARHWHEVDAFLFDWSLYHAGDKAVKCAWSGNTWDRAELERRIAAARDQLTHLSATARTLEPGEYRAYLAPAALDELLWMLNWGGVSEKAQRTKQSCIQKLADGQATLSPMIRLTEDTAGGMAPGFDEAGFSKPARVELVNVGRLSGSMVSPRTGAEYGIETNGADEDESMSAMALAPGALPESEALAALDRGLYIGNLHYLNFSDRANGRVTGMTRFATFWVEGGRIAAPANVMRWDDSLYRMLGSNLEALTDAPQWILNNGTYGQRSVQTSRVPGALLRKMAFTL